MTQDGAQPIPGGVTHSLTLNSPVTYVGCEPIIGVGIGTALPYGGIGAEFELYGENLGIGVYCRNETDSKLRIDVAELTPFGFGAPVSLTGGAGITVVESVTGADRWVRVEFPDDRRRRVTVFADSTNVYLRRLSYDADGAIAPVAKPRPDLKFVVLGDSFVGAPSASRRS